MKRFLGVAVVLVLSSGCSTLTPARYAVSIDNHQALKAYSGAAVKVASVKAPDFYDTNCRLVGDIEGSDGMTIPQFVEKAFNDELKFANLYSDTGILLTGTLTRIEFSSSIDLISGLWDLAIRLKSSNGKSMDSAIHYGFKSGFDGLTACHQTAQALGAAVQDLINKVVTDPRFGELIR